MDCAFQFFDVLQTTVEHTFVKNICGYLIFLQATVVTLPKIFIAARGPLVVGGLVVVHDGLDVCARSSLTVIARISG